MSGLQDRARAERARERRLRRRRSTCSSKSARVTEAVTVTGGAPLLKTDRADVATIFETEQITDLPVLDRNCDEVPAADAGHAAAGLATCREREPARVHADPVERPALQRHRLSARRHAEPRPHPRHHRHQPHARVDRRKRRSPRRTTTPSLARPRAWSRCRPSRGRTVFHGSAFEFYRDQNASPARNPFTQPTRDALPDTHPQPVRRIGRRADSCRTACSSSATTKARASSEGGSRLLTVPTAAARSGDPSAYGVSDLRPGRAARRPPAARSSRAT